MFQLSYSETLFHNENGTPITFCVKPSEDSTIISQLIKAGGGRLVEEDHEGVIYLSSNGLNLDKKNNAICTSFVYACCFSNTLLDMEDFRIISGDVTFNESALSYFQNEDGGNSRLSCSWEAFSKRKIHDMLVYMIKCEEIWKKLGESKVLGCYDWRNIRKNFCFWALEKINESPPFAHSTFRIDSELSPVNQGDDRASSSSCPIQSSLIDVNAKPLCLIAEKKWGNVEGTEVSEEKKDRVVPCEYNEMFNSSSADTEEVDGKKSESEKVTPMQLHKRKMFLRRRGVAVIIDSEESSSEEERTEGVQRQVERKDEVVVSSREGVNKAIRSFRSKRSTVSVQEKESQGRRGVNSGQWLGKHIFDRTCRRKNVSSNRQSEVNDDLESDSSEVSGGTDLSEENNQTVRKLGKRLRMYTVQEDLKLLEWICHKKGRKSDPLTGNRIWKFMESRKVLEGRSWQSMRERFRRHIVPNLKKYPLSEENLRKIKYELE